MQQVLGDMCLIIILKIDNRTVVESTIFVAAFLENNRILKNVSTSRVWYQSVGGFMLKTNSHSLYIFFKV